MNQYEFEQQEFEQQLAEAIDLVEQGYITQERMALIRYACGVTKKQQSVVFNFDEIR